MNRRDFFKRMGGAALAVPLAMLGLLGPKEGSGVAWKSWHAGAIVNSSFGRGLMIRPEIGKLEGFRVYHDPMPDWKQWHARAAMDDRFSLWPKE